MRLFIAIPLPDSVKEYAIRLQDALDKKLFRETKKDQIHLTIAFLGEVPDAESIIKKLEKIRFNAFILKTKNFGFFPSINKVRVAWVGLEENGEFMKLQHDIRENFHFKEKLMPHITIARARNLVMDRENHWNAVLSKIKHGEIEFDVDKFILYESVPEKGGYIHKALKMFEADKV